MDQTGSAGIMTVASAFRFFERVRKFRGLRTTYFITMDISERPLLADCVEEVGELIVRDRSNRQAHAGSPVLKRTSKRAAGSALPAFGGSGRWPPGGTRPEHPRGLSA